MPKLQLVTLSGTKFDDDVYEVIVPTMDGEIGVLPGHMPLVSVATDGVVYVRHKATDRDDMMEYFAISGGVVKIEDDVLQILVDEADHADEVSETEVKAAYDRAVKLKAEAKDQVSLDKAQSLIDRSATRLKVAEIKRRHHRR